MKLNHKFVRTVTTTAAVLGAAAMLSVGAFAAEADINDPAAAGYLPPQEQMVQGDIALHSADVAIGEKDPTYGGYGAPEGNPIQGNIMLISGDDLAAPSADAAAKKSEARYTVKCLFGREVLYTTRDTLAECMEGFMNSDYQETYALTPVTYKLLTPETDCLLQMGDYPERLSKWLDRFTKHIADNF